MKMTIEGVNLPVRKTKGSCGYDIHAPCDMSLTVFPKKYDLGILMEKGDIPEGHYAQILPRSSTGNDGTVLANTCGVIDSDYTMDTIKAKLYMSINNALNEDGTIDVTKTLDFKKNDRILQMIVVPFDTIPSEEVPTEERKGGHGSTGA